MSWNWKEQNQTSFDVFLDQSWWICKIFLSEDTKILHCIISFYTYGLSLVAFCHQPHPNTKEPGFPWWVRNCTGIDGKPNHTRFSTFGSISLDFLKDFGRPCWTRNLWIFFWCNISNQKERCGNLRNLKGIWMSCSSSFRMSQTSRVSKVDCLPGPYLSNAASIQMLEIGNLTHLHPWSNLFQLDFKHEKCRPFLLTLRAWLRYG